MQTLKGREREEDCRKGTEEERQAPQIHLDGLHVHGRRKGRENFGVLGGQRMSDEGCAQHGGSEEVDGRMENGYVESGMAS